MIRAATAELHYPLCRGIAIGQMLCVWSKCEKLDGQAAKAKCIRKLPRCLRATCERLKIFVFTYSCDQGKGMSLNGKMKTDLLLVSVSEVVRGH